MHALEARQVQMMRDGDPLGPAGAVDAQDQIGLAATRVVTVEQAALRDSSSQTVSRSVIRVISLGAKTRNGGPQ